MSDPWVSFWGTIIAALIIACVTCVTIINGFKMFNLEQEAKRNYEISQERKVALFDALNVIDLVYSNERLNNSDPLNSREWDINLARQAMNKMLIYCKDPQKTITTFYGAIGLYNPDVESVPGVRLKCLDDFRRQVAFELGLPEFKFRDSDKIWLYSLSGTKEAKELAARKSR
jgi:hypothetical protein